MFRKFIINVGVGIVIAGRSVAFAGTPIIYSEQLWQTVKTELKANPAALAQLKTEADSYLKMEPVSVTQKKTPPPSGDLHDYASIGPYWWPDPDKPDGRPYIRKDGQTNPEFYVLDNTRMEKLCSAVTTLALYYYVSGSAEYAQKAAVLVKTWFVDPATKMNPNLRYAQAIRGINDGRGIGIIDTVRLIYLLDAVGRLPEADYWTTADLKQLQTWFADYVRWLKTHPFGQKEEKEHNNHGTWYDAQIIAFSIFSGEKERIAPQLKLTEQRIRQQIKPDGSQPAELARTLSLSYSTYNLMAYVCIAEMTRAEGINLWQQYPELLKAVHYLKPYYADPSTWTHKQIKPFAKTSAMPLLSLAASADPTLQAFAGTLGEPQDRILFGRDKLVGRKQ